MTWTPLDTWIVVAGVICAMACAILGNFLVLQRLSMMGDAISHAVLPGLALAFLVTGSRHSVPMFIGAAVVGVLTAVFTQGVHQLGKVERSAAMGVVFTTLFALGLVLLVRGADAVDLDPGCVLYGAIEMVPLDTTRLFGVAVPRAVVVLGAVLVINVLFTLGMYKELQISSFDPALANTQRINATLVNGLLMTLVAVTTVAAFETVGSILVIAMLIVPAAAAHLLTDRLSTMIVWSLVIAAACAVGGHLAAITVPGWFGYPDTSTAGMMATVAGLIFLVVMLGAPRHGVISRAGHRAWLTMRVAQEDLLGLLYRAGEREAPAQVTPLVAAGGWLGRLAFWQLRVRRKIVREGAAWKLTPQGLDEAASLVRAHRLWESYLHRELRLPIDHVHDAAERLEHITNATMQRKLARETGEPTRDPQGKKVP